MKAKTLKNIAVAMSLAVMPMVGATLALNPIVAYAAEIDSVAFQEAINAEGSNITAVPYSPTEGETPDLYCVDNWTVDENGCTYTANQVYKGTFGDKYYGNGMIYLNIPEDGKIRTLKLSATFSDIYGGLKIYADGYSADNGKLIYEYADTSSNEFTDKEIIIGNEGTDFYIVTSLNSLSSVTLSNMSLTAIDSLTYDVGDEATAVYQDGILTISGTGTVEDISAIPDIVKNNIKTLIIEEGITSIINDAFSGLSSITYIDFPSTLEYLEGYVFRDCTGLTEIYLDCPKLQLNGSVFMGCINVSKVYLEKIALSIKQVDVVDGSAGTSLTEVTTDTLKVTTPVQLGSLAENSKLAHLESGYGGASQIGINLETDSAYTNYGKACLISFQSTFCIMKSKKFMK